MAWTAPTTYTVGQVLTAANVNTYLRDNSNYVAGTDKPHCRVFNSAAQSPTNSTPTALTFDSERVDVGSLHSTASSTTRITVPTGGGGWWAVGGTVAWAANATGVRQMYARVNGSAIFAFDQRNNNTAGDAVVQTIASRYQVAAGDYFELFVFQNSGAALAISATANYSPEFWAEWVAV